MQIDVGTSSTAALLLAISLAVGNAAAGGPTRPGFHIKLDHPGQVVAVRRALLSAHRFLSEPRCQALLAEYRNADGWTLEERLTSLKLSAPEYLETIDFVDGADHPLCRSGRAYAVATPGRPRVLVCGGAFDQPGYNLGLQDAIIIHEMLHTLGLGENPPSSLEITQRVRRACTG